MLLVEELEQNNVQVVYNADVNTFVDPQHLKQVFLNLMKNAMQAMSHGGTIKIAAKIRNDAVQVQIADSGTGISKESANHIFDPFFTTRDKGLGLGLSMVKNLVEENGGTICLKSTGEPGTTFEILLSPAK
jgi:signal transduction histidine kinase